MTVCLHCGLPKWKEADYVNPYSEDQRFEWDQPGDRIRWVKS